MHPLLQNNTMEKSPCIYIMTNRPKGTLYIGVSSDLLKRVFEHRSHVIDGFTTRYNLDKLVYYECYEDMYTALTREKNLKNWKRIWKISLIEKMNPAWLDLYHGLVSNSTVPNEIPDQAREDGG